MALRDKIRLLFEIKDSPHRISVAFALGIFIGMSPLLGIHTVLGLLVAWLFRLNKLATLVGVYITNPWTIVPIYTFSTWVGAKCLGMDRFLPNVDWKHISWAALMNDFRPLLMPFVVGTFLMGTISAALGYVVVLRIVRKRNA